MVMGSRSRLLFITAVAVVAFVVIIAVFLTMPRPLVSHGVKARVNNAVSEFPTVNQGFIGSPISLNIPIYVVGSSILVQRLVNIGVNESLIRPVSLSQLAGLPNGSLIIIDWSMIGPNLTISRNGLIHVNVSNVDFKLIRGLIRRGDFIIIHGNSAEAPVIEYALALAWSKAFNIGIVAIPVPKFPSGLSYIVAYGNDKMLIIGPHSLASALRIVNEIWAPLIMKNQQQTQRTYVRSCPCHNLITSHIKLAVLHMQSSMASKAIVTHLVSLRLIFASHGQH